MSHHTMAHAARQARHCTTRCILFIHPIARVGLQADEALALSAQVLKTLRAEIDCTPLCVIIQSDRCQHEEVAGASFRQGGADDEVPIRPPRLQVGGIVGRSVPERQVPTALDELAELF